MPAFIQVVGLALALVLVMASPAAAEEESTGASADGDPDRSAEEAEMFGGSEPEAPASDQPADAPTRAADDTDRAAAEESMFGEADAEPVTGGTVVDRGASGTGAGVLNNEGWISAKLSEAHDKLAIGGRLYLRGAYAAVEESRPWTHTLSGVNLLDLYLDGRPVERVRAYIRGRLTYNPHARAQSDAASGLSGLASAIAPGATTRGPVNVALDQMWLRFDIERVVFVTLGKQPLKWGTGRFWNPTDFLNPARRDPLAVFDERLGVFLAKLDFPAPDVGNFYVVGLFEGADRPDRIGGAARAEFVAGPTEFSFSVAARKDTPLQLGADLSAGIGEVDIKLELAVLRGVETPYFRGNFDPAGATTHWDEFLTDPEGAAARYLPVAYSRKSEWIPQLTAGFEVAIPYSDQDSLYLGAEYFYNHGGYDSAKYYPWMAVNGAFAPLYNGRHYAALYMMLNNPGDWNETAFILSGLANLSDLSFLTRLDYRVTFFNRLQLSAYVAGHFGRTGGEFRFGLRIPKAEGLPTTIPSGLPPESAALLSIARSGLRVYPPVVDVGLGLLVEF